LTAADGGLVGTTTNAFTVTAAAADHLAFSQQPTSATAGVSIAPPETVRVLDQFGNVVTTDGSNVTLAIAANPGGGTLSGTTTIAAAGGIATFANLSIDKAGAGYTLAATDGALTGASSASFTVTAAAAHHLAIGQQPTSTSAGAFI